MTNTILNIAEIFLILLCGVLAYKFLPAYFIEKGKNLATKEDIGEITKKVEEVRVEFTDKTETLKSELQILSSTKLNLISEERQALLDFHDKFFYWFEMCINVSFGNIDTFKNEEINLYLQKMSEAQFRSGVCEARMELFINDIELLTLKNDLKIALLDKLATLVPGYLSALRISNIQINVAVMKQDFVEHNKLLKSRIPKTEELNKSVLEKYKTIIPLVKQFRKESRTYLYKLFAEQ